MLKRFFDWLCRPFVAYIEARAEEARIGREHQLALVREIVKGIEALADGQVSQAREQSAALIAIAQANAAQAASFSKWFESFQITSAPTSSSVSEEEEWATEQRKLAESYGLPPELGPDLPEEFRLAHQLQAGFKDFLANDKL